MHSPPTADTWAALRKDRPTHAEALSTRVAGECPDGREILFGIDFRSGLHLLIPAQAATADQRPPDLQGLRVRHRVFEGDEHYLDLSATAPHERLFSSLASDVLQAVADDRREPWKAVSAILRAWQSAWRPVAPEMTKTVQVGLFGELLTLEHIMIKAIGSEAVYRWSGPEAERHDFVGNEVHLEVKTTRKSRHEHEISRLDQLDPPKGRRLLLVSILVEESIAGTETIASKIDQIVELVRVDAAASDAFMTKVVKLGWSEELRRSGQLLRFTPRNSLIFEVNDSFPRMPSAFRAPDGVFNLRYSIGLANIPSMGIEEAIEVVRNG